MPKTFTAQSVTSINPLRWVFKEGELVDILVRCEVNYGELGMTHEISIFGDLTQAQKNTAKAVYQFIKNKAEKAFLD